MSDDQPGLGGVVAARNASETTLVLRGFTAWRNKAKLGGVVGVQGMGTLSMSGALAWNNQAQESGGVAYCEKCRLLGV